MVRVANSTLPTNCVKALGENATQCIWAKYAYQYSESPIFIVNSGVDLFQIALILTELNPLRLEASNATMDVGPDPVDAALFDQAHCVSDQTCSSNQTRTLLNFQQLLEY